MSFLYIAMNDVQLSHSTRCLLHTKQFSFLCEKDSLSIGRQKFGKYVVHTNTHIEDTCYHGGEFMCRTVAYIRI